MRGNETERWGERVSKRQVNERERGREATRVSNQVRLCVIESQTEREAKRGREREGCLRERGTTRESERGREGQRVSNKCV